MTGSTLTTTTRRTSDDELHLITRGGLEQVRPRVLSPLPVRVRVVGESELIARGVASMLRPFSERVRVLDTAPDDPGWQSRRSGGAQVTLFDCFPNPASVDSEIVGRRLHDPAARGHVVAYSWRQHPDAVSAALSQGFRGYLAKSLPALELVEALESIRDGRIVVAASTPVRSGSLHVRWPAWEVELTPRERDVLLLIASGISNREIAQTLCLSENSVKSYIRAAYRRIGITTRSQAVLWGAEHGFRHSA